MGSEGLEWMLKLNGDAILSPRIPLPSIADSRKSTDPEIPNVHTQCRQLPLPPPGVRSFQHVPDYLPLPHFLYSPLQSSKEMLCKTYFQTIIITSSWPTLVAYVRTRLAVRTKFPTRHLHARPLKPLGA